MAERDHDVHPRPLARIPQILIHQARPIQTLIRAPASLNHQKNAVVSVTDVVDRPAVGPRLATAVELVFFSAYDDTLYDWLGIAKQIIYTIVKPR